MISSFYIPDVVVDACGNCIWSQHCEYYEEHSMTNCFGVSAEENAENHVDA
jgi:hypothetical protein